MVDQVCAGLGGLLPAAANPAMRSRGVAAYADLKRRVPDRPGHDRRYAVDSGLIRRELGWAPRYGLEEGLAQTVRWYAQHRDWCRKVQEDNYDRRRLGTADRVES
ncbi:MAG: GDP-mannose 4,6-dehydratase, partial [Acidobacteria bacterium]|nr:GDP-mannose 4,6-dehydratase [Acidobacteriota bacterium]